MLNWLLAPLLWYCHVAVLAPSPTSPPVVASVRPMVELDARFRRTDGWTGSDGVHSVALSPNRTLLLFSDTWVGRIKDGTHFDATIVNNTVGILTGRGSSATVDYFVRRDANGKPQALVTSADGRGWFRPQAEALVEGRLLVFLPQFEKTKGTSAFSFRPFGLSLGIVDHPQVEPTGWVWKRAVVPQASIPAQREVTLRTGTGASSAMPPRPTPTCPAALSSPSVT